MIIYRVAISLLFMLCGPALLFFIIVSGIHRPFVYQRLGLYRALARKKRDRVRFWLHGASVGEVQAVKLLIQELRFLVPGAQFVVTTMTVSGKRVAEQQLGNDVRCLLTPLDIPLIVNWVVAAIDPDVYVCVETELWPSLLHTISAKGISSYLVNGRMSAGSCRNYGRLRSFFASVINSFDHMAFISEKDKGRFLSLGGDEKKMSVEGNVKYDLHCPEKRHDVEKKYQKILAPENEQVVLVGGSTHSGEEKMLVNLFLELAQETNILLVLAPRHLERLDEIESILKNEGVAFQRFSTLKAGEKRSCTCIVLDVMGELSTLYALGTYIFCGGSVVNYGGHNIMEPAAWGKVVFYGPFMDDFSDAKELLEFAGGGFEVQSIEDLGEKIRYFMKNQRHYEAACHQAGSVAKAQLGNARRQAEIVASHYISP